MSVTVSPCSGVCMIEFATGVCAGCQRTLEEISRWATLDEAGRAGVMRAVEARRAARQRLPRPPGLGNL